MPALRNVPQPPARNILRGSRILKGAPASGGGGGTVTYDATGPSSSGFSGTGATGSWTHTATAGAAVVVFLSCDLATTSNTVTCTYGGASMTLLKSVNVDAGNSGFGYLFGIANVTGGAATVAYAGAPAGAPVTGGSVSFNGADTTVATAFGTPVTATAATGTQTITLASTSANSMVFGGDADGGNTLTGTSAGTSRWFVNVASSGLCGSSAGATSPGTGSNVTITWTGESAVTWGAIAVEVLPGAATVVLPPQTVAQRRETWPRGLPRRARVTLPVPAQQAPSAPAFVPQPARHARLAATLLRRRPPSVPAAQDTAPPQRPATRQRPASPRRSRVTFTVPPQLNPPYPVAELRQWRQPRGFWPVRGRRSETVPAQQAAVPAPPFVWQPLRHARIMLARRGRAPAVIPGQDAPVTQARRTRPAVPPRRMARQTLPVPPQLNPPYPVTETRQWRQPRGLFPVRGHRFEAVPAQQAATPNPAWVQAHRAPARAIALLIRRGRAAITVPPQLNPPYPIAELRQNRQPRGFWPVRGRRFETVPSQQAATPAPPWIPAPLRRTRVFLGGRRSRVTFTVPPQLNPPYPVAEITQRRETWARGLPRRGRTATPVHAQAHAPLIPQRRGPLRAIALIRRRFRQLLPWPQAVKPPFSVGTLTASDTTLATLTAADAPGGTSGGILTAADQRTGGPGG